MDGELLANRGIDAARRELCGREGRVCQWDWTDPQLARFREGDQAQHVRHGDTALWQSAICARCGRRRAKPRVVNMRTGRVVQ